MNLFYLFIFFVFSTSYASNRVALSWVPYNNDETLNYFRNEAHPKILNSLGISPQDTLHLNFDANGPAFSKALDDTFSKIAKEESPELFLMISGHGNVGIIGTQACGSIPHQSFLKRLYSAIGRANFRRPPIIHFFYSACMAGSFIDALKESPPHPGTRLYLYASSTHEEKSRGKKFHHDFMKTVELGGETKGQDLFNSYRTLQEGRRESTSIQTYVGWTNDQSALRPGQKSPALLLKLAQETTLTQDLDYAIIQLKKDPSGALEILSHQGDSDVNRVLKIILRDPPDINALKSLGKLAQASLWKDIIIAELGENPSLLSHLNQSMALDPETQKIWSRVLEKIKPADIHHIFHKALITDPLHALQIMKSLKGMPEISQVGDTLLQTPQAKWPEVLESLLLNPKLDFEQRRNIQNLISTLHCQSKYKDLLE